ncbi:HAD-IA family hydrolase [Oceanithermus sp.]
MKSLSKQTIPDAAGIIAALEATTGKKVEEVVGKPSPHTVRAALERLELPAERAAMVGDRLETDILMARRAGLVGILTLSGVTRPEDLDWADEKPDYVIESLAALPELDERLHG